MKTWKKSRDDSSRSPINLIYRKTSKTLLGLIVLIFRRVSGWNCFYFVIFYETFLTVNCENSFWSFLWFIANIEYFKLFLRNMKLYTTMNIQSYHKRILWQCSGHSLVNIFFKKKTIIHSYYNFVFLNFPV